MTQHHQGGLPATAPPASMPFARRPASPSMARHGDPAPGGRQPDVLAADAADLDTLSQVIADAFHDLAPSRWLIPDPAARRQVFPRYFRIFLDHALAAGVVLTTADRAAAALWLPISQDGPAPPAGYDDQLAGATGRWVGRFQEFDAAMAARHPAGIAHHYLALLAVRPDRQSQGTGTALLRAYHHYLDHDIGAPAYLEASGPRTRRLYMRHGYADHGRQPFQLPDGPAMYPMWRERGESVKGAARSGAQKGS
jgi:GNAT superfamily N-acetyltransferase